MPCRHAHEGVRRCRIAAVDHILRLRETADAAAVDMPDPISIPLDLSAEAAHRLRCRQHILTFQEAGDGGSPAARPPKISERWEIDLSPGTKTPGEAAAEAGTGLARSVMAPFLRLIGHARVPRMYPRAGSGRAKCDVRPPSGKIGFDFDRHLYPALSPLPRDTFVTADGCEQVQEKRLGEAGMGHQADLPVLWHPLLRLQPRSDRLSVLRCGVRPEAVLKSRRARVAVPAEPKKAAPVRKRTRTRISTTTTSSITTTTMTMMIDRRRAWR